MRAPNYLHLGANVVATAFAQPSRLGLVVINTKGVGNTLTLYEGQVVDAARIIAIIDTTAAIGPIDYGQLELDALTVEMAGGTPADITISWG